CYLVYLVEYSFDKPFGSEPTLGRRFCAWSEKLEDYFVRKANAKIPMVPVTIQCLGESYSVPARTNTTQGSVASQFLDQHPELRDRLGPMPFYGSAAQIKASIRSGQTIEIQSTPVSFGAPRSYLYPSRPQAIQQSA